MCFAKRNKWRVTGFAGGHCHRAARMKAAARWHVDGVGGFALQNNALMAQARVWEQG